MAANINTETYSILHDSRGEDVRDSLCEACQKIAPELLPVVTAEDAGKVMGVNQYGQWVAARYVPYWRLQRIAVTTWPTKMYYFVGDQLDMSGVVITAYYASDFEPDKTEVVTSRCNFSPVDGTVLTYDTQSVHVEFSDGGVTAVTSIPINVSLIVPTKLTITAFPTKMQYEPGDALDLTGISITATYNDGTTANVTSECTFTPPNGTVLTKGNKTIEALYQHNGSSVTTSFTVRVFVVEVTKIEITTPPTKTEYDQYDQLDLTGIVVTAVYNNDTTEIVTSACTYSPANGSVLSEYGNKTVTVSYANGGKSFTASFSISVEADNTPVGIITLYGDRIHFRVYSPSNISYDGYSNDMVEVWTVNANGNKIERIPNSNCTFSLPRGYKFTSEGNQNVLVSYSTNVNGVLKTFSTSYTVTVHKGFVRIEMASLPSKTVYNVGNVFSLSGCSVIVTYTDGTTRNVTNSEGLFFIHGTGEIVDESWISNLETGIADIDYSYSGNSDDDYFSPETVASFFEITINT